MDCKFVAVKSCLGVLSLLFWVCAVGLIVIGCYILADYGHIKELAESTDILVPAIVVISVGVFLLVIGFLGCVGGMKENKAALSLFFIGMLVVLVGEVVAVALVFHYRIDIEDKLTNRMHEMIDTCANDTTRKNIYCAELDFIQTKLHCCGATNYTDWLAGQGNRTIPQSCCKKPGCQTSLHDIMTNSTIYTESCSGGIFNRISNQFTLIFVGAIVLAIIQVLGLVATCLLLCRSKELPYSNLDSQGYRI